MSFFQWTKDFDLGVSAMNDEHKVLIGLMNEVYELHFKSSPKVEILMALIRMIDYTKKHFADEEAYLDSIKFPAAVHKGIHKNLMTRLYDFKAAYEKPTGKLDDQFFEFLKFWLSQHICGVDQQYGKFARELAKK